jgi:glycosyltransferase involved in cell wall biosynthesis
VKQKGFDVLLRAWVMAGELGLDLLIAGDGMERANLEQLAMELGIGTRVKFIGRSDRKKTAALFKGCEFFVLPSRHEPFGIVNLEAMAAGKAVIATRVGGVPEVVADGESGLLVPPNDVEQLGNAIARLCADSNLRVALGEAAAARAVDFDWAAITARYVDIYEKCRAGALVTT